MRLSPSQESREFLRVHGAVVDLSQQDVLVRHLSAGLFEIGVGRLEDVIEADFFVDRHQGIAQARIGSMQRNGQMIPAIERG